MGLCLAKAASAPWQDLLQEIGGQILSRLSSDEDCISYGAICRDWRLAMLHQPPPGPWINLGNGTDQSIENGMARCFATSKGYSAHTSFNNWVMYRHEGSGRCFLRGGPFSPLMQAIAVPSCYLGHIACSVNAITRTGNDSCTMITSPIDIDRYRDMKKVVVCPSYLVVMILRGFPFGVTTPNFRFAKYTNLLCFMPNQRPSTAGLFIMSPNYHRQGEGYKDIAVYRGKTFALTESGKLFCHDLFTDSLKNYHEREVPLVDHVGEGKPTMFTDTYLVVSSDQQKLLMVRRNSSITDTNNHTTTDLQVFEADFDERRWLEVKDLAGQILFVSRNCSKALAAGSRKHHGYRFQIANCVFVVGIEWARTWTWPCIKMIFLAIVYMTWLAVKLNSFRSIDMAIGAVLRCLDGSSPRSENLYLFT